MRGFKCALNVKRLNKDGFEIQNYVPEKASYRACRGYLITKKLLMPSTPGLVS